MKNIILLMTDQHRMDYVSYAGSGKMKTANIDRIAESVGFTSCQTVNPYCTPARTALITGKYTHQIGTLVMSGDLSLQHPTYMQALQKAGYHTSGVGKLHFLQTWEAGTPRGKGIKLTALKAEMKKYGYDYIWETSGKQLAVQNYCDYCAYLDDKGLLEQFRDFVESAGPNIYHANRKEEDFPRPWPFPEEDYVDVVTCDKIIERIEQKPEGKPFFIFGSFCSPHKPFDPPQRYLDMFGPEDEDGFIPGGMVLDDEDKRKLYAKRRSYKAMIKLLDDQVGRIFDALDKHDLLDNTVILFTSDHGEMLGDHGLLQKGFPYAASATVPLAIRHPDYLYKKLNPTPVEIIDVAATILDIAGIDPRQALSKKWPVFNDIVPSKTLMPILRGEADRIRDFTFSECRGIDGRWQMIQTEHYKYVRYPQNIEPETVMEAFYDLDKDPDELCNLAAEEAYQDVMGWFRRRRDFIMDNTPPAQTSWAPLITA